MISTPIFTTAYFPPISYMQKWSKTLNVIIESQEHFQKKSYRNRCEIVGANGIQTLSVPIEKKEKAIIKDTKIAYHEDWQKNHFKAIESAYRSGPYYEYIIDDFIPIFTKKHAFLFDLNLEIISIINQYLKIDCQINQTKEFSLDIYSNDYRQSYNTQNKTEITKVKYKQIFEEKLGFFPDVSVLDLIFNTGPDAELVIKL